MSKHSNHKKTGKHLVLHEVDLSHRQSWMETVFKTVSICCAYSVFAVLIAILINLGWDAYPAFKTFGWHFFVSADWNPSLSRFGAFSSIIGTLETSLLALLFSIPISFGIAVFLSDICPKILKRPIGVAVELLAGIPSIIYGMWALFVLVPLMSEYIQPFLAHHTGIFSFLFAGIPIGMGVFTASVVLAIMIIPFSASVMRDAFDTVSNDVKEAAYGMGATKWEVVRHITLPATWSGSVGSMILGLGRALGETMAVTFVIGNSHMLHIGLFYPANTISSAIANEFAEADTKLYGSSLIALGLILFIVTFIIVLISRLMIARLERAHGKRE